MRCQGLETAPVVAADRRARAGSETGQAAAESRRGLRVPGPARAPASDRPAWRPPADLPDRRTGWADLPSRPPVAPASFCRSGARRGERRRDAASADSRRVRGEPASGSLLHATMKSRRRSPRFHGRPVGLVRPVISAPATQAGITRSLRWASLRPSNLGNARSFGTSHVLAALEADAPQQVPESRIAAQAVDPPVHIQQDEVPRAGPIRLSNQSNARSVSPSPAYIRATS